MRLELVKAKSAEELEMERAPSQNPLVHNKADAVLKLNADDHFREMIRLQEEAASDYVSCMARAERQGMKIGLKRGRAQGLAEGLAKARAERVAEGRTESEKEIAENMRAMGFSEEQILSVLGK